MTNGQLHKKPKTGINIVISLVLAVIIIGVGGYVIYQNNLSESSKTYTQPRNNDNTSADVGDSSNSSTEKILLVDNPIPRGDQPDKLYILSSPVSNKPITAIETNIYPYFSTQNYGYQLVKEKIYFFDSKARIIKWLDFNGNVQSLDFTKMNESTYSGSFVVSSDGEKIAWVESEDKKNAKNENAGIISRMISANINGSEKKIILENEYDSIKYIKLIQWNNTGKDIYFSDQRGELGGYIVFGGYFSLNKINVNTGKTESVIDTKQIVGNLNYYSDISPDEEYVAYFTNKNSAGSKDSPKLVIANIENGKNSVVDIPIEDGFEGGGNARFSPDSSRLVYNIAHWDPEDEYYRTLMIDVNGENQRVILDQPEKLYISKKWASNDEIILRDEDGDHEYFIVILSGFEIKEMNLSK